MLYVKYGANDVVGASIKCNCGRLIIFTMKDENFPLSNYRKHLCTKGCTFMNLLKKKYGEGKKLKLQQAVYGLTSLNSVVPALAIASQQQKDVLQVSTDFLTVCCRLGIQLL
ncbi:unnamed protein product [Adineta ricciae]|uniref:Uncharacterized protein n=1 Tax=Adineta ricciae TaxID=249248 RepID=A0A815LQG7_ADIRI|nr:unnamed protein product [Adineta ricciae]CAF1413348.1 unnamed protein product [Adineta ricciae]